ncbi:hypothetical protein GCM10022223_32210 [Kineosporia mesophila]|uniref:Peptidase inhibitor family I36 n=1 Tax=Kineosporia mesophila TaxID=566012 RepID=A0ABP6ZLH0_9ACTN|nr:hypothetical protein [Kineosporia mesophila]MCD5354453.1 hypothetical protein [Kineosporia mesophila]
MHRLTKKFATALMVAGSAVSLSIATSATAQAATSHGCPSGYVCLYPQSAGWNNDVPSYKWYTYGGHNLTNQYGTHRLFNNQTGGAVVRNCYGTNGTNCAGIQRAGTYYDYDYTPYNSVKLSAS